MVNGGFKVLNKIFRGGENMLEKNSYKVFFYVKYKKIGNVFFFLNIVVFFLFGVIK